MRYADELRQLFDAVHSILLVAQHHFVEAAVQDRNNVLGDT